MKNKLTIGVGACSFFAGLLLANGGFKGNAVQILALAGLFSTPTAFLVHLVVDSKTTRKVNEAQEIAENASEKLSHATALVTDLGRKNGHLTKQYETIQQTLTAVIKERDLRTESATSLKSELTKLERLLKNNKQCLTIAESKIEELDAECERWELEFHGRLESEAEKRFQAARKEEILKIQAENDELTREAMDIVRGFRQWGIEVDNRLADRGEFIKNITVGYNNQLEGLKASVEIQIGEYLTQIEILHCKVADLQQKLKGDLTEPEYLAVGYANDGAIANDIAREVWNQVKIPLAVKGYQVKGDGSCDVGYSYSRSTPVEGLVEDLNRISGDIAKLLRINKITSIRKHDISDLIVLSFRREAALKENGAKLLAGSPEEFLKYIIGHPIRYRLIADPGEGKTPTTAVMLSAILKEGCRRSNTTRGKKVPHTLVSVSYPGAQSSLKDSDYPLDRFLKYGTTTAAIKSFDDAVDNWKYRQQNVRFAEDFFQIWVWDELDNTINSADDPNHCSESFKTILKQGGHSNIGWIVSGQSVMTSQIKGFKDDDRSLFTEIIIGIPKIKMYIHKYGKGRNSDANLARLEKNLDDLEGYIESLNERITDDARLLRIALVIDAKSPKLYFLPNLDNVDFDEVSINESENKAAGMVLKPSSQTAQAHSGSNLSNPFTVSTVSNEPNEPKPTIGGLATCPHCGNSEMTFLAEQRYKCKPCNRKIAPSKVVFK